MSEQHPNGKSSHTEQLTTRPMGAHDAQVSQSSQHTDEWTMPERPYDQDAQAPTHDALSAIYNWGY